MMHVRRFMSKLVYNGLLLPAGAGIAFSLAPFHSKVRETLRGRRGWKKRWQENSGALAGAPVWFHVSSVGEYEQAKPVINALKEHCPEVPVLLTFLSPSGFNYALRREKPGKENNIKLIEYLPLDFRRNARFCLAQVKPRLLVFVKFDLWPNLIWNASKMGIPSILIDATLSSSSYRTSRLGQVFYRQIYQDIDRILAISAADAERFHSCVPEHNGIETTGDTRFDRVAERKAREIDFPIPLEGKTVVIAGSTWPPDEVRILPAFEQLLKNEDKLLLIIAPHEPSKERVSELGSWAENNGFPPELFSHLSASSRARVIIVDVVGVLAELYRVADVAYVGGSFSCGVHNVIEPAIMGIPVLFGPVHDNAFEALELSRIGGGIEAGSGEALRELLEVLVKNPSKRAAVGEKARAFVESHLGATQRCLKVISEYLPSAGHRSSAGGANIG